MSFSFNSKHLFILLILKLLVFAMLCFKDIFLHTAAHISINKQKKNADFSDFLYLYLSMGWNTYLQRLPYIEFLQLTADALPCTCSSSYKCDVVIIKMFFYSFLLQFSQKHQPAKNSYCRNYIQLLILLKNSCISSTTMCICK